MKMWLAIFLLFLTTSARASLESDAAALALPDGGATAPSGISSEKLYALQTRANSLSGHLEVALGAGRNFTPGSFLTSSEVQGSLRYYLSDRVFTTLAGSYVFSSLSDAGNRLWQDEKIFPDVAVTRQRADLTVGLNAFYGKFRLSVDRVFYFDQYFALGAGAVRLFDGVTERTAPAGVGEIGFAFWFDRQWELRLGVKDYLFQETRRLGSQLVQHVMVNVALGWMIGGGGA